MEFRKHDLLIIGENLENFSNLLRGSSLYAIDPVQGIKINKKRIERLSLHYGLKSLYPKTYFQTKKRSQGLSLFIMPFKK